MPAIWASSPREDLPTRVAKRPVTPKDTAFLYLLRKNERDLKTVEFDGLLGQIREVFSAFPGVLKQPTAHLSTLVPWGARKTEIWADLKHLVVSFLYLYAPEYSIWKSF